MKQKIVIRVSINSDECRSKVMELAAMTSGVESVAIQGDGRDQLAVVGDEVDAADLTIRLRVKMGTAKLISVEAVASPKVKPSPPSPSPPPPIPTLMPPSPLPTPETASSVPASVVSCVRDRSPSTRTP